MNKRKIVVYGFILFILAIAIGFIVFWPATPNPIKNSDISREVVDPKVELNEPQLNFTPAYKEKWVPLNQVKNYEAIKSKYGLSLSASQEKFLEENRFLLIESGQVPFLKTGINFDQWLANADSLGGGSIFDRKPEDAVLVTPDLVLHAYHKYFELTLEQLEQHELSKFLSTFLNGLHSNLAEAVAGSNGQIKVHYQNLEAQIVLARVLFENKNIEKPAYFSSPADEQKYNDQDKNIDTLENAFKILDKYGKDLTAELKNKIKEDLTSIYKADEVGASPLFIRYDDQIKTDYTQFTPRSHYTKNSNLRAYFRTMMLLGRSSYYLKNDLGIAETNLLVKQFERKNASGQAPLDAWKKISAVTSFYAGQSDDLSFAEWKSFKSEVLGAEVEDDKDLIAPENINKLAAKLDQLRLPKILSDIIIDDSMASRTKADLLRQTLGFRIFGQKFTFDAWILNDLTAGVEKTDYKLPSTPSALFIPAAFGDKRAENLLPEFLKQSADFVANDISGFLNKFNQKKTDIAKVKKTEWFGSMGSAWLYVLGSLTYNYGEHYPLYMQGANFLDKQLQTFLGSYAELKHDTLLYAKQSYAELGAGGQERPIPPVVKGFVEPNLEFWTRFNELLERTDNLFTEYNLFKDNSVADRLEQFKKISKLYSNIAERELRGEAVSDEDYESLRTTKLSFMAQPFEALDPSEKSGRTALIADIHTDGLKKQILYEATAEPYFMLAIIGNEDEPRIAAGLAYNHYELTGDLKRRLTDDDWHKMVYDNPESLPSKNFWYSALLIK